MERKKSARKIGVVLFVLILLASNIVTYFLTRYVPVLTGNSIIIKADDEQTAANINKLLYLKNQLLENSYYNDEFTEQDLWDGAFQGLMMGTGDNYAYYFNETEAEAYNEETSGSYVGIGVVVGNNDDGNIEVSKVFAGSPAEAVGVLPGDIIISADDESLIGVAAEYGVTLIKGPEGTTVDIGVVRGEETIHFDIVRATITYVFLEYEMLNDHIGYIHIYQFADNTYAEFSAALEALQEEGMTGLIMDIRQNPGGLVNQALEIADDFLPDVDMIYVVDTNGEKSTESSDAAYIDIPLVVLIDEYSASSSEIVSIALQVNDAAEFVGVQSYGKGIIQTVDPIALDGTMYKYTVYEYFGADGTPVHDIGIVPDYVVEKGEGYDEMFVEYIPHDEDAQLQKALDVIEDQLD